MISFTKVCAEHPQVGMAKRLRNWVQNDDGAITVDWVVLTATMTVIGGVIVAMTVDGTTDVGAQIGTVLENKPVN